MKGQEKAWDNFYKNNAKWKKETLNLPKELKNKKVLELGVGNGKSLKSIIKQTPKEIIALDLSQEAIAISKRQYPNKNILYVKGNVCRLPFKKGEFDVIVCYYLLNSLIEKERKKAVKEIIRVLRKGGKILFEDFADGDFRKNGKSIEKNTIIKENGITCHYFEIRELKELFLKCSYREFKIRTYSPFRANTKYLRRIIEGKITT